MKEPKCKICGGRHYAFQCWKNPHKKIAVKHTKSGLESISKPKMGKVLSKTKSPRKDLIRRLDKVTSEYVRRSYADKKGIASCYTCGRRLPWRALHNGHYKSRQFIGIRFDFDNMRPQCLTRGHKVGGKDVSKIEVGDVVPSLYGQTEVIATKSFESPIIEIEYEGGKIKSSPEHAMVVEKAGKWSWMSAQEIYNNLKRGEDLYIIKV